MNWWHWVVFGFVLMALELFTPGLFFMLFFAIGAVLVGILVALGIGGPMWLQWLLFTAFSLALILGVRKRIISPLRAPKNGPEVDSLVGMQAQVLEDMVPGAAGKVELRGSAWKAKNVGSQELKAGQGCKVDAVQGLSLQVRPE